MSVNATQHFMNQATYHSRFPIMVITKFFGFCKVLKTKYWFFTLKKSIDTEIKNPVVLSNLNKKVLSMLSLNFHPIYNNLTYLISTHAIIIPQEIKS